MPQEDFGVVVPEAAAGQRSALDQLARACVALARRVARRYRLPEADSWDVCQDTWLLLAARLGALRDPRRLPGWLVTTASRLCLKVLGLRNRFRELPERADDAPGPEARALAAERDRVFWRLATRLPARHHRLLVLLAERPEITYPELAAELGVSPESVGPLRRRCFLRMRRMLLNEGITGP